MNPHILEALIGGAIAAIPLAIGQLITLGGLRRILKDYPPHRHEGDRIIYSKGYEPSKSERLAIGD